MDNLDAAGLLVERDGAVAVLTLDRPRSRNALTSGLISALQQAFRDAEQDPSVHVVLLTGTDPAFCAGLDLKELAAGGEAFGIGVPAPGIEPGRPWARMTKPVVGAVNGPAFTGGLELALHCDVLIASERASFGDTHAKHGLLPAWGMSVLLPAAVGRPTARHMSLTGTPLPAQDALRAGLVSQVTPHDELQPTARALARVIAGNPPEGTRALLAGLRAVDDDVVSAALVREAEASRQWQARVAPA